METILYEMMETGVGPAKAIGGLFLLGLAILKVFFMSSVIAACFKYIHKDD